MAKTKAYQLNKNRIHPIGKGYRGRKTLPKGAVEVIECIAVKA
jgi:hypothetical protein